MSLSRPHSAIIAPSAQTLHAARRQRAPLRLQPSAEEAHPFIFNGAHFPEGRRLPSVCHQSIPRYSENTCVFFNSRTSKLTLIFIFCSHPHPKKHLHVRPGGQSQSDLGDVFMSRFLLSLQRREYRCACNTCTEQAGASSHCFHSCFSVESRFLSLDSSRLKFFSIYLLT